MKSKRPKRRNHCGVPPGIGEDYIKCSRCFLIAWSRAEWAMLTLRYPRPWARPNLAVRETWDTTKRHMIEQRMGILINGTNT